jgi:hypothetical protein
MVLSSVRIPDDDISLHKHGYRALYAGSPLVGKEIVYWPAWSENQIAVGLRRDRIDADPAAIAFVTQIPLLVVIYIGTGGIDTAALGSPHRNLNV